MSSAGKTFVPTNALQALIKTHILLAPKKLVGIFVGCLLNKFGPLLA